MAVPGSFLHLTYVGRVTFARWYKDGHSRVGFLFTRDQITTIIPYPEYVAVYWRENA